MIVNFELDSSQINDLDISTISTQIENWLNNNELLDCEQKIKFVINYPQSSDDPREFSEISEIRLWFVRLDAAFPWLPFLLDWKSGELARYTAMLVPHQFSRSEGIIFNPEALEIFVMSKIFVLSNWCKQQNIPATSRLKSLAQLFGYDIETEFFEQICPK